MKKIITAAFFISSFIVTAQEKTSNWSIGADVQSRYVWRGVELGGASPSIQPYAEYSTGKFTFGAWGAYSLGGTNLAQELDLYLTVDLSDDFHLTIIDYYFPTDGTGNNNNYLDFGSTTGHVYEAALAFGGTDRFPLGVSVASNFAGASTGSTYVELNYTTDSGLGLFAGGVFGDDDGYYFTTGSGLINLGLSKSKDIKITDNFSLPVNASLIVNPDAENVYLTFGFSL